MSKRRSKSIVEMALKTLQDESISDPSMYEDSGTEYIPSTDESNTLEYSFLKPTANEIKKDYENLQVMEMSENGNYLDKNYFVGQTSTDMSLNISNLKEYEDMLNNSSVNFSFGEINMYASSEKDESCSEAIILPNKEKHLLSNDKKRMKRIRREHQCQFCFLKVKNFARHLERNHSDEFKVQQILSLNKNCKERTKIIDKLRKEGDFYSSKVVPVVTKNRTDYNNHLPCKFCMGYFAPKNLRKHAKKCYYNPDPSTKFMAQIEGQNLMIGHFGPTDPIVKSGLFRMLRADDISLTAKKDKIITEVARRYIKSHKEKHLLVVAKRQMRRLSRLLISVRKILNIEKLSLMEVLKPSNFKVLIKATKEIAEYDETSRTYKSPTLALQMGTLLKNAINAAVSMEVQKEECNKERLDKFSSLTTLLETDWASEISSEASQNLNMNKFNKPSLIPAAEDIKKFETYLMNIIRHSRMILLENPNDKKAYRKLLEGLFCSLLIFNKRRVGELQRMVLSVYLKNVDNEPSSEFQKVLSATEKILCQNLKRVVIRGKRGRGVPVLFDKKSQEAFDVLIRLRDNFGLQDNLYLFGVPDSQNSVQGYIIMRKHAKAALGDPNKAAMLTSTRLRKHLGTIAQIFRMEKNDLEQLATFMGHEKDTHMAWYRLPDDVYQTAKVSKLLMLAKKNNFDQFKGKSLDEIELDEFLEETDEETEINENPVEEVNDYNDVQTDELPELTQQYSESPLPLNNSEKSKRKLVPWTTKQKKLTEEHFKKHIKRKIPPKKKEVEELINKYPDVFRNKTWPVIKVYICNKYNKM